jgi:2-oxoglutarate dehydrogenase E2 component (dihydrolipoamide succinyltransferase)
MIVQVKVPMVGESISEVTIGSWLKKDGEIVETDEPVCEIESEKASMEIPAEEGGKLKILVKEGETVPVGAVIGEIDTDFKAEAVVEKQEIKEEQEEEIKGKEEIHSLPSGQKISHVAAKMLEEAGISPDNVTGSGPGGRIVKADAIRAIEEIQPAPEVKTEVLKKEKEEKSTPASQVSGDGRLERREKMTTLRKTIANRLLQAKHQTAMLTTFNEIDMSMVIELRKKYQDRFREKYGIKLGFMSFFTKAVTIALKEFPAVNAQIDGDEIVYFEYCDIGIAVSTDRGLIVPIVRNAEKLSLAEIEKEIARLAERARTGKITIDEMTGGTFSITNGGIFGSLLATPLINYPQTAILGMHAIQERPVVRNGEIVIRPMMYVALSYDHRLIDGKESVSFLKRVKEIIEDPARLVLEI